MQGNLAWSSLSPLPIWISLQFGSHPKKDAPVVFSPQIDLLMSFEATGRDGW